MDVVSKDDRDCECELAQVRFSLLSPERIKQYAVCEIVSTKMQDFGSLNDARLGPVLPLQKCVVCQKTTNGVDSCAGHFGYLQLNEPVVHPLLLKYVCLYLKAFCTWCHKLVFPFYGTRESAKHIKHLINGNSYDVCVHCLQPQPQYTTSVSEGVLYTIIPKSTTNPRKTKRAMTSRELLNLFMQIPASELAKLGTDTNPSNFILTVLPVLPNRARPALLTETIVAEDDLTVQYLEIMKINMHLADTTLTLTKRAKYIHMLAFRIKSLFDNSSLKSRHTNNHALRGLKERISGKSGIIRCNLSGKRCNMSARTVLGPDVSIPTGCVAVPPKIAQTLTVPETVTDFNKEYLNNLIETGQALFYVRASDKARISVKFATVKAGTPLQPHDVIVSGTTKTNVGLEPHKYYAFVGDRVLRKGQDVTSTIVLSQRRKINLCVDDVVERCLRDGDMLLLNRQPTLHSGSMIGLRVQVREGNTFRIPLSITKQLGADFDGDEVSAFVPILTTARAELEVLSSVEGNFFCAQGSTAYVSLVQDGLLGMYLLTKEYGNRVLPRSTFMQFAGRMYTFCTHKYTRTLERCGGQMTGHCLVSMALPETLDYTEGNVIVRQGLMLEGELVKTHLNGGTRSLIFVLGKYYSPGVAIRFVDDMQFLANAFLEWRGFTVGIGDCMPAFDREDLERVLCRGLFTASQLEDRDDVTVDVRERYISMALSQTRDVGMHLARAQGNQENNFVHTVTCGSKGAFFNIAQITTLLGQQVLKGSRIQPQLHGQRTLVHYPFTIDDVQTRFESRGFVRSSFLHGLNPREFFFHAVAGREGIIDTSMKTSTSGYSQRRIVKFLEDVRVMHDGTVRDESNNIIQHQYAHTGLDPKKIVRVNGEETFADVRYLLSQARVSRL